MDVICARNSDGYGAYEYENVRVLRIPITELGHVLVREAYDAVLLHFFDEVYAAALDGVGLGKTRLFLWSHNPETRYWEWPLFTTPYFTEPPELTEDQRRLFEQKDAFVKIFNNKPNVSWIFISEAQKKRAEELIGISFNRSHVIANLVDEQRFPYAPKDPALRTKVFCVRKFDNIATYAVDLDVAAVLELSKRPVFGQMEFDFFGDGPLFDTLLEPIRHLENVRVHKRFLSHDEIAQQHATHGIGLFATRFDSQGVSMCEAAMSGLAVVSSDIDAANIFLPNDLGLLCETENPAAYADAIERLATDPDYFARCSAACHEKVFSLCRREMTIDKEIALLQNSLI
ncbi:MAG: glycosyltransferase family 4 protein [Eggerthellaceae bacterium]|nr:glycosyltransferase family 4 protein [Eggerthellaceae bacterium]